MPVHVQTSRENNDSVRGACLSLPALATRKEIHSLNAPTLWNAGRDYTAVSAQTAEGCCTAAVCSNLVMVIKGIYR